MPGRPQVIRSLLALAALGATLLVLSGCGTTTTDTARGRELFKQKCGVCHTLAQAGTTAKVGPDLDRAFGPAREVGEDDKTIKGIVEAQVQFPRPENGNPSASMPADVVTGQDLDDVAAYVGKWAGVPGAKPPEVAGGPGAQVFANNGCGTCHTLAAANAGGTTGPDFDEVLPGQSAAMIKESIEDPNAKITQGYPANVMPTTFSQTIEAKEIEELVEYLIESTSKGKAGGS